MNICFFLPVILDSLVPTKYVHMISCIRKPPNFRMLVYPCLQNWDSLIREKYLDFKKAPYGHFLSHGGTPKSCILVGFSLINHPFWGTPISGNPHGPHTMPIITARSTIHIIHHCALDWCPLGPAWRRSELRSEDGQKKPQLPLANIRWLSEILWNRMAISGYLPSARWCPPSCVNVGL